MLRQITAGLLVAGGAAARARRRQNGRLRILMYHGVWLRLRGPAAFGELFISAEAFARQMRHVRQAFDVLSVEEAVARARQGRAWPARALAVTFDDGYRNTLEVAGPILKQAGIPSTVFLSADLTGTAQLQWFDALRVAVHACAQERTARSFGELNVDGARMPDPAQAFRAACERVRRAPRKRSDDMQASLRAFSESQALAARYPEFALAGWAEWKAAVAGGLVSVGSHGLVHEDVLVLPPDERMTVLSASKARIERELGRPCLAVAYPYGRWNEAAARAAQQAGYGCGLTTDPGLNRREASDPFAWRRTMVGDGGSLRLFQARASGAWDACVGRT